MPNTLIPIQTYTLSSTASSVTFSNIPQNYTDLKVVVSARGTATSTERVSDITLRINNDSSASYSYRGLTGVPGSSSTSTFAFTGSSSFQYLGFGTSSDATANTFGSTEFNFVNYTSSVGKSISVDTVAENNSSTTLLRFISGLWSPSTQAAISTLAFSLNSGNFDTGSTFTLYGISNGVKATGGTLTVAGGYAYHTFTSTGSFLPSQQIKGAEVLCIAGGGGGGLLGGGGGAGGVLYASSQTLNAGNSYTALVGSGASGTTSRLSQGANGSNSVFSSVNAIGGGAGGTDNGGSGGAITNGAVGGSGGGGGRGGTGGSGTQAQGNSGGNSTASADFGSGGGGGAGTSGATGTTSVAGAGGNGTNLYSSWHSITGTGVLSASTYYVGGGGGGTCYNNTGALGGLGGGADGSGVNNGSTTGAAGTANTGGGGGASRESAPRGGNGGSGLIIIRYPLS